MSNEKITLILQLIKRFNDPSVDDTRKAEIKSAVYDLHNSIDYFPLGAIQYGLGEEVTDEKYLDLLNGTSQEIPVFHQKGCTDIFDFLKDLSSTQQEPDCGIY